MMKGASPTVRGSAALVLSCSLLLVGGCRSVGPNYTPPNTTTPTNWSASATAGVTTSPASPETLSYWWAQLNDPILSDLMERARAGNLDVRQAEARLRAARAQRGVSKAALFPNVAATASASRNRGSGQSGATDNLFANGFDASWEMDVFGKKRRVLESADATMQASQEAVSDALVSLFAEVALNYVEVRSDQLLIALTETSLATRAETCDITRWRHEAGLTTQLDVDQAQLSLEQARADLPTLRTSLEKGQHRLAVLMGQPPGRLKELLADPKAIPAPPLDIAVGVPADVLRRRPDIRQAERKLAAQTAQIGVAQAARYPDFSLLGSIGIESLSLGTLYNAGARTAQAAANATWTLFDGGSLRQAVQVQTALQEEALSLYEATVLTALEDVENALLAYANEQARRRALQAAVQAGQSAFELARDQYTSGLVDFQTVLDMQRTLLSVQDQLIASDAEVTANVIRLYKALGGGWNSRSPAPAATQTNNSGGTS